MTLIEAISQFALWGRVKYTATTISTYVSYLHKFHRYCGDKLVTEVNYQEVLDFLNLLEAKGLARGSVRLHGIAIRQLLKWAKKLDQDVLHHELVPTPFHVQSLAYNACSEAYFVRLMELERWERDDLAYIRNKTIISFLYATGVRNSELCDLKVSNMDFQAMRAEITTKKNSKPRIIVWDEGTNKLLQKYIVIRGDYTESDYLFVSRHKYEKMTTQAVRNMLKKYVKKAGLEKHIVPHSFRHGLGHRAIKNDVNLRTLQVMLGHKSITSTQVYTPWEEAPIREAQDKMHNASAGTVSVQEFQSQVYHQLLVGRS